MAGKLIPIGSVFGRLTVVGESPCVVGRKGGRHWECVCSCGKRLIVTGGALRNPHGTRSCKCLRDDNRKKAWKTSRVHGHCVSDKQSRTYFSWRAMIQRCYNPKHSDFPNYGAVGITPCKAWRESFRAFLNDMGTRPIGKTLDRFDNRFGYFLANCRWATPKQQAANRRAPRKRAA